MYTAVRACPGMSAQRELVRLGSAPLAIMLLLVVRYRFAMLSHNICHTKLAQGFSNLWSALSVVAEGRQAIL